MAHHNYWNLAGHDSGTILEHEVTIYADKYTPGDPRPDRRQIKAVKGTPLDFTNAEAHRQRHEGSGRQAGIGYDANWIVQRRSAQDARAAKFKDPKAAA